MIEYSPINPSIKNARAVQRLTLQDVTLGEFSNPRSLANPNNPSLIYRQIKKLREHPERYEGSFIDNSLEGYMKTSEWALADELPFAGEQTAERIRELMDEEIVLDPARTLGIFGLVVSNKLEEQVQDEIIHSMLDFASDRARDLGQGSIKIVLHGQDPVLDIARQHGYQFTGRVGVVAGAPGLVQRLYRKPLDS